MHVYSCFSGRQGGDSLHSNHMYSVWSTSSHPAWEITAYINHSATRPGHQPLLRLMTRVCLTSLTKVFNQLPPLSSPTNLTNSLNMTWPNKNGCCCQSQQCLFHPAVEAVGVAKYQQNGRKQTYSQVNEQDRSKWELIWISSYALAAQKINSSLLGCQSL